jgi:hypothetical protein
MLGYSRAGSIWYVTQVAASSTTNATNASLGLTRHLRRGGPLFDQPKSAAVMPAGWPGGHCTSSIL